MVKTEPEEEEDYNNVEPLASLNEDHRYVISPSLSVTLI